MVPPSSHFTFDTSNVSSGSAKQCSLILITWMGMSTSIPPRSVRFPSYILGTDDPSCLCVPMTVCLCPFPVGLDPLIGAFDSIRYFFTICHLVFSFRVVLQAPARCHLQLVAMRPESVRFFVGCVRGGIHNFYRAASACEATQDLPTRLLDLRLSFQWVMCIRRLGRGVLCHAHVSD